MTTNVTTSVPSPRRARDRKPERGIAIAMVALLLLPMLVFAAFGVDLASWYARISELQRAADAAALAGTVWMPDYDLATEVAEDSLRSNEMHTDNDEFLTFLIERGDRPNSLKVTVTDTRADRYFSSIFIEGHAVLSRYAEAEYNLPLPLGSPLNYFGGDHTRVDDPPPFNVGFVVNWPLDYTSRAPFDNSSVQPSGVSDPVRPPHIDCHITNTPSLTGRWVGSPPSYRADEYGSGPACGWAVSPAATAGTSAVPPPDYWVRPASNIGAGGCRVRDDGSGSGTVFGRWLPASGGDPRPRFSRSGGSTSLPTCQWDVVTATDSSLFASHNVLRTVVPQNQPCLVGYTDADGYWSSSSWTTGRPNSLVGESDANGNRLCTWSADITYTTEDPPNPIDPGRSPGFWAAIEGPDVNAFQGDPYSTRCYTSSSTSCSTVQNDQYQPLDDDERGKWYVIRIPTGLTGSMAINIFDASMVPGGTDENAGDRGVDGSNPFSTFFQVYQAGATLDIFNNPTALGSETPTTADGDCYWEIPPNDTDFQATWRNLCTIDAVAPGQTYLLNVQTRGTSGDGVNGYAVEAVANGSHDSGVQPSLYAYDHMTMQNNNTCEGSGCTPPTATFYLAEVAPQYAGKTLVLELWDSGDVAATLQSFITPMMPDLSVPRPVNAVGASECEWTAMSDPNPRLSVTGDEFRTPQPPDDSSQCEIETHVQRFNGEWLRIRIQIPNDYTCTLGRNPETTGGSCWWGMRYRFTGTGGANDVTTWQARVEGNPLQLTE